MRCFLLTALLLLSLALRAHTVLTFQPDSACGKDALLTSLSPDQNYGLHGDFLVCAWTNQSVPVSTRCVVEFDLSTIPAGATIVSATLELFHHVSLSNNIGHSNLSAPATAWLERITQPWTETTVTWNNQPATTTVNRVNVPAPVSMTENYSFNVTAMVIDMMNDPANSHGFMMRQQTESYYRSLLFSSSDGNNSALFPKLTVTYSLDTAPSAGCWTNFVISPANPPPPPTQPDPEVVMPNVFSPNADGINDFFFADSGAYIAEEMLIYNRWGNLVYGSSPGEPWDGTHNDQPCSDGTYYYVFRYSWNAGSQSTTLTGFFTLVH